MAKPSQIGTEAGGLTPRPFYEEHMDKPRLQVRYDDKAGVGHADIAGRPVRFRGSREAAEKFFERLAQRIDEHGLVRLDVTSYADIGRTQ
jgi:hypothetical protein